MNYMEQVAKMLGVEPFEKFKLKIQGQVTKKQYVFSPVGFYECDGDKLIEVPELLSMILIGRVEIVKPPWKPIEGERGYYVNPDGVVVGRTFKAGSVYSLALYTLGKFYRTEMEAEVHADEDKKYWENIWRELQE